ncbi:hypothetical protein SSOG_01690 [Streptomyces himastatinicus ATCC 53653]|uniref:Uncharacterized protein n=1 Tax=Streptomyces himastatinicus ATCC 53653 TaxID=457427 RepID=D9WR01_9ACTN|nr:hypothetical protein [Streptomyces himastatinicus]EFL21978.1 hypothetical protein SSOG_01690 [Streptomyces himastatinicus ATCC 53653]
MTPRPCTVLNTAQQVGGALGLAVMSTLSTSAATDRLPGAAAALYRGLATPPWWRGPVTR